jgi:hypothetical protein
MKKILLRFCYGAFFCTAPDAGIFDKTGLEGEPREEDALATPLQFPVDLDRSAKPFADQKLFKSMLAVRPLPSLTGASGSLRPHAEIASYLG